MIIIVTQARHRYTLKKSAGALPYVKLIPYDDLYRKRDIPAAAYIFTDFDRLSYWELELAGRLYKVLKEAGCPVYNNPAIVKQRFALLRTLKKEGINQFGVYRPSADEWPQKYPVFVRRDCFHAGTLSDLLHDRESLEKELSAIQAQGIPELNTMVVEYAAEPAREDIFIKYSAYRIGERLITDICITERDWVVKGGQRGCMREEDFLAERERVKTIPHEDLFRKVFELANIEYGRLDYGLLNGMPQIYEINTNPTVRFEEDHPSPIKVESRRIVAENFSKALKEIADQSPSEGKVEIRDSMLRWQFKRERRFQRSRPTI